MQISVGGKFLWKQLMGKIPHSNNKVMCRVMRMQMQIMLLLLLFLLHELEVMLVIQVMVMVVMAENQMTDTQMVRQMRKNFMMWLQVRYGTTTT
jgi:hypothetical protein